VFASDSVGEWGMAKPIPSIRIYLLVSQDGLEDGHEVVLGSKRKWSSAIHTFGVDIHSAVFQKTADGSVAAAYNRPHEWGIPLVIGCIHTNIPLLEKKIDNRCVASSI
jgi:hypothetical protein